MADRPTLPKTPERIALLLKKRQARSQVMIALDAGRLQRQPCADCSAVPAQAHHDDYDRPLDIRWLCSHMDVVKEPLTNSQSRAKGGQKAVAS